MSAKPCPRVSHWIDRGKRITLRCILPAGHPGDCLADTIEADQL